MIFLSNIEMLVSTRLTLETKIPRMCRWETPLTDCRAVLTESCFCHPCSSKTPRERPERNLKGLVLTSGGVGLRGRKPMTWTKLPESSRAVPLKCRHAQVQTRSSAEHLSVLERVGSTQPIQAVGRESLQCSCHSVDVWPCVHSLRWGSLLRK